MTDHHLITALETIRAEFMPAEKAADVAAARTARLLATALEQRAGAGMAIGTGAGMIRKLSQSLSAQIEAREAFILAHKLAVQVPLDLGLDPTMFGDASECPPDEKRALFGLDDNVIAMRAA